MITLNIVVTQSPRKFAISAFNTSFNNNIAFYNYILYYILLDIQDVLSYAVFKGRLA